MPKKKKTQQKPIPRGFAVTSIPKKAPPVPLPQDDSDAKVTVESASATVSHPAQTHELIKDETLSRQNAEERSLQELVDRLQERTEKEIVRTIKVRGYIRVMLHKLIWRPTQTIETERRFSNTFPLLDLDAGVVSGILEVARGSWSDKGIFPSSFRSIILADMSYQLPSASTSLMTAYSLVLVLHTGFLDVWVIRRRPWRVVSNPLTESISRKRTNGYVI
jgi:hypothetical protein